ncbi:MAG: AraC family transcriptional regulator [Lachnospiraceae bacterium]|nr:AraC family transcriptional regulator [Lachnospiraceae bacterium]
MGKKIGTRESVAKKIKAHIESHRSEELSLDKIAEELNYSKFYMERAFAETTGTTIHKYIQERRLAAAAEQLVRTDRSVIDIALEAGYGSHQAFTQAFRKQYLCSPRVYRKNRVCQSGLVWHKNKVFMCRLMAYDDRKGRLAA